MGWIRTITRERRNSPPTRDSWISHFNHSISLSNYKIIDISSMSQTTLPAWHRSPRSRAQHGTYSLCTYQRLPGPRLGALRSDWRRADMTTHRTPRTVANYNTESVSNQGYVRDMNAIFRKYLAKKPNALNQAIQSLSVGTGLSWREVSYSGDWWADPNRNEKSKMVPYKIIFLSVKVPSRNDVVPFFALPPQ